MTATRSTSAFPHAATRNSRWGIATPVIVAAIVVISLLGLVAPVEIWQRFGSSPAFAWHYWRPLLFGLATGGFAQLLTAAVAIALVLPTFARSVGQAGAAAVFGLSGLGAATALTLLGPMSSMSGALHAVLGVVVAQVPLKRRQHLDHRPDLIVALVLLMFVMFSGAPDWPGAIGALIAGLVAGVIIAATDPQSSGRRLGLALLGVGCLVIITATWLV